MVPSSPKVCYGALGPPVGGTFHFENLIMPPLPKTCPKMVLSHKGGSLCVKDVFAKKFFGVGEIPLAARSHRFFGNTLLKAGHLMRFERCVRLYRATELECAEAAAVQLLLPAEDEVEQSFGLRQLMWRSRNSLLKSELFRL